MNLRQISTREQLLIFLVAFTVVVGGYGLLRYRPAHQALATLIETNIKTEERTKNMVIPDEPFEDAQDLKDDIAELDLVLDQMQVEFNAVTERLASDDQEVIIQISNLANTAGVRVRESLPYLVTRKAAVSTKSDAGPAMSKRSARLVRQAQKRRARKADASGASSVVGDAPIEGELAYRLLNDLDEARPFHKLTLEGSYFQVQQFIESLNNSPYMVTVTQLKLEATPQVSPAGYPQPIVANMILVL